MESSSIPPFGFLNVGTDHIIFWSYEELHQITNTDISSHLSALSMHAPPPPPPPPPPSSITFTIEFTCKDSYYGENNHEDTLYLDVDPYTIERKEFNKMDMMPFMTNKLSVEDAFRTMFLNTRTWNSMISFDTCHEMPESMFSELSEIVFSFLDGKLNQDLVSEIVFYLEVRKYVTITVDDMMEDFMFLNQQLQLELQFELGWFDEQDYEYSCPAPQALLERMVTEVFQGEGEDMDCVICLEELVSGMEVKRLPCSHCFHGQCIDGWFQGMDKCPLCRFTLPA
ncbi:Zinc finger RING/FYVE/PHD-type protein [Dioscorea alata]|uniref:Zinc finger RING/FYVE/PHD-type protein n=1 Tax=Dioscorea alata TaxID=55571 RepID=A0ACB7VXZ4_DIOAL|nr:Zinc finger RING/FYVE/PHD-type protein [Dioscorea alata]